MFVYIKKSCDFYFLYTKLSTDASCLRFLNAGLKIQKLRLINLCWMRFDFRRHRNRACGLQIFTRSEAWSKFRLQSEATGLLMRSLSYEFIRVSISQTKVKNWYKANWPTRDDLKALVASPTILTMRGSDWIPFACLYLPRVPRPSRATSKNGLSPSRAVSRM